MGKKKQTTSESPLDIIKKVTGNAIGYLIKDENHATGEYHKIAVALRKAGFEALAERYERMSKDESRHERIQIRVSNKYAAGNKAKKREWIALMQIATEHQALSWMEAFLNLDEEKIELLEEDIEGEGQELEEEELNEMLKEQAKVKKEIDDSVKSLRFKSLKDMIGFYDAESENWSIPADVPRTPFDGKKLLQGWKQKEINVISIIHGHRHDATINAYVRDYGGNLFIALAKRNEYENAVY